MQYKFRDKIYELLVNQQNIPNCVILKRGQILVLELLVEVIVS